MVESVAELPAIPATLVDACAAGSRVLFAGLGLAAQAGPPTWTKSLEILLNATPELGEASRERRHGMLSRGALAIVAGMSLPSTAREHLCDGLVNIFPPFTRAAPAALASLAGLPFRTIVTANWGDLLDPLFAERQPHVVTPFHETDFVQILREDPPLSLKLAGDLASSDALVLSQDQYRQLHTRRTDLSLYLMTLYTSRVLLFLGVSLAGIEDMVSRLQVTASSDPTRRHFALVSAIDDA